MVAPHVYERPESSEKTSRTARNCPRRYSTMVSVVYLPNDLVYRVIFFLEFRLGVPIDELTNQIMVLFIFTVYIFKII